jgi:hypothetical protein
MSQEQVVAPSTAPEAEAPQRRDGAAGGGSNAAVQEAMLRRAVTRPTPATTAATATPAAATVPSSEVDRLLADPAAFSAFFARPPETVLAALVAFANADVARVAARARTGNLLGALITALPSVPGAVGTRVAMKRLLDVGGLVIGEAKTLFQRRFAHEAKAEQTEWRLDILTAVWAQLDLLPDQDVSANTVLTTFNAINGGGGTGPSWEAPGVVNTIRLGQQSSPAFMAHTVRHEIGHAVHAQISAQVNPWLQGEMQFWFLSGDKAGVKSWLDQIETWPATYTDKDGNSRNVTDTEKDQVATMVESWMGRSGWGPTRPNVSDGLTPELAALWAAVPTKMKNGIAQSTNNWYSNWTNFQAGSGGKTYFLNHYYHRPYHIGARAAEVIRSTGDSYTAMSEQEFFANSYAEYFKDPAGYSDATKWGGNLPASVKEFFRRVVVSRQPYTAPAAVPPAGAAAAPGTAQVLHPHAEDPAALGTDAPPRPDQLADATGAGRPT